jgi:hypothetical protein
VVASENCDQEVYNDREFVWWLRLKHGEIIVSFQNIIVPFPYQVTDLCILETVMTGSGDSLTSCSVNKGNFRKLRRSRDLILTNPFIVGVKTEWNYNFTSLYVFTVLTD